VVGDAIDDPPQHGERAVARLQDAAHRMRDQQRLGDQIGRRAEIEHVLAEQEPGGAAAGMLEHHETHGGLRSSRPA
jgi:hypothetical protein